MRRAGIREEWVALLVLLAAVALALFIWWPASEIHRVADANRVSQMPEEWMKERMASAATVLCLSLQSEQVKVAPRRDYLEVSVVFHAVVEECVLGDIPVGSKVWVEACDVEETPYPEANAAIQAGRSLEMTVDYNNQRAWLILPADDPLEFHEASGEYCAYACVSMGMEELWWGELTEKLVQKYMPLWVERKKFRVGS